MQLFNASVREEILYRLEKPDRSLYQWVVEALDRGVTLRRRPCCSAKARRRVALATMLMRQPRHGLLLDQPALGQDEGHKAILLRLLQAYAGTGHMVIYSTHDLESSWQPRRMSWSYWGRMASPLRAQPPR